MREKKTNDYVCNHCTHCKRWLLIGPKYCEHDEILFFMNYYSKFCALFNPKLEMVKGE